MSLKDKLNSLETILSEKHPRLISNLLPPILDKEEMHQALLKIVPGHLLPSNLIDLYSWKNGTTVKYIKLEHYNEINSDSFIIPAWFFMDFAESVLHFKEKNDVFKYKKEYYFPFLFTGFGHYLTLKLIPERDKTIVSDGIYIATKPRQKIYGNYLYYKNMNIFIESVIECYNHGAYYENTNGILSCNVQTESEICYKLTPNSSHWHLQKFGELLKD